VQQLEICILSYDFDTASRILDDLLLGNQER